MRSSIWFLVSRTSTSGSTIPVGRTICSTVLEGLRALPGTGRRREQHHLPDPVEELVELERAVVDRRGQPEAEVHQGRLAREVALVHAADLGDRLVGLVDEGDEVVGEVVDQRVRRVARGATVEDPRVVLDPRAEAELAHHLHVVLGPLHQPVGLELLALRLEQLHLLGQLEADLVHRALHRLFLDRVVARRPDRDVVDHVEDLAGQRVEVLDALDLVAEELDPVRRLGVGGVDLEDLAAGAEGAAAEAGVVAAVLHARPASGTAPRGRSTPPP